jgi:hypothetical protein
MRCRSCDSNFCLVVCYLSFCVFLFVYEILDVIRYCLSHTHLVSFVYFTYGWLHVLLLLRSLSKSLCL